MDLKFPCSWLFKFVQRWGQGQHFNFNTLKRCCSQNAVYSSVILFYHCVGFRVQHCRLSVLHTCVNSKNTCWYCDWCYCGSNECVDKSLEKCNFFFFLYIRILFSVENLWWMFVWCRKTMNLNNKTILTKVCVELQSNLPTIHNLKYPIWGILWHKRFYWLSFPFVHAGRNKSCSVLRSNRHGHLGLLCSVCWLVRVCRETTLWN